MLTRLQNRIIVLIRFMKRSYSSTNLVFLRGKLPAVAYQPELVEKGKYERWENNGLFQPEIDSKAKKFVMALPPPNVTGRLHLGHALGCTIQDVIIRRCRALGYNNVLWVPGMDHAGIATQGVVEKYLQASGNLDRNALGRQLFIEEIWKWKEKYGADIERQLKRLGCALDWTRHSFTMDHKHTQAVNTAFIKLFDKGLVYRAEGLVNWCNHLKSTVSDVEVEKQEIDGPTYLNLPGRTMPVKFGQMYTFAYKVFGSNDNILVSTTMPETMLGDVAIAVNPDDERYSHLVGKIAFHPFRQCTIPIIFDKFVDMKVGTGAVKITPAHSKTDYEVARRYQLALLQVIDENSRMINSGDFNGLDRYQAREKIVAKLADFGYLKDIQPHKMNLPICSRTGDVIDYLPKEQWYLSCGHLNERAKEAVKSGSLEIFPKKFLKYWDDWTAEDRDWCISRQLWWGHRIPAYKCTVGETSVWVSAYNEYQAKTKGAKFLRHEPNYITAERDPDVLDTWFSSAVYPFACLGWPQDKVSLKKYYPLDLMVTGHDILGFWVHRMIMLGLELTDRLPFQKVLLHGIICDSKGAKMSKSKGNVIDPMDVIEGISLEDLKKKSEDMVKKGLLTNDELDKALDYHKSNFSNTSGIPECGADALRFTLLTNDVKSHFVNFDVNICQSNKLFCNKMWQSTKYVQMICASLPMDFRDQVTVHDLTLFDRWILHRLAVMVATVNKFMDSYDFHLATKAIRHHLYNEFCDVYLETTKPSFNGDNDMMKFAQAHTLSVVLHTGMRCLNPFMVYLTEEIIPKIPSFQYNVIHNYNDEDLKHYSFPLYKDFEKWEDDRLGERVETILKFASVVRELKGLCGMPRKVKPNIRIKTHDESLKAEVMAQMPVLRQLAQCGELRAEGARHDNYIRAAFGPTAEVWLELIGGDIQETIANAKQRMMRKIDKLEKIIFKLEKKLELKKEIEIGGDSKEADENKLSNMREELKRLHSDLETLTFKRVTTSQSS